MAKILFEDRVYTCDAGESVLDALNRQGCEIASGCRAGVCQACVLLMDEQDIARTCQQGLSPSQQKLNHFLACQCRPQSTVHVHRPANAGGRVSGVLRRREQVAPDIYRVFIAAELDYQPGQYVTILKSQAALKSQTAGLKNQTAGLKSRTTGRSYSLASHPQENASVEKLLELHVKCHEGGELSPWLCHELQPGEPISLIGPMGSCIYSTDQQQPLLLAGMGTGLAPVLGVLKDALHHRHRAAIHVLVGAAEASGLYHTQQLLELSAAHANLRVNFLVQYASNKQLLGSATQVADIYQYCAEHFPDLKGYGVYLCGAESFVRKMRKQSFLAGAAMTDISADAFIVFG